MGNAPAGMVGAFFVARIFSSRFGTTTVEPARGRELKVALVKSLVQRLNERAFGCHSNVNDCAGRSPRAASEPGGCRGLVNAL